MFNVALEGPFINVSTRQCPELAGQLPHPTDKLDGQPARLVAAAQISVVTGELSRRGEVQRFGDGTGRGKRQRNRKLGSLPQIKTRFSSQSQNWRLPSARRWATRRRNRLNCRLRAERLPPHRWKRCTSTALRWNNNLPETFRAHCNLFPRRQSWIQTSRAPIPGCPRPIGIWVDRARLKNTQSGYAAYRSNDGT